MAFAPSSAMRDRRAWAFALVLLTACSGDAFTPASGPDDAATRAGPEGGRSEGASSTDAGDVADGAELDASAAEGDTGAACACRMDLSNVDNADFYLAFTITTTSTAQSPILNQRSECDALKPFWAVAMLANGQVNAETNDGMGHYGQMHSTASVNDGMPHHVLVSRRGPTLAVNIDGQVTTSTVPEAVIGALPPLQVGTETSCPGVATLSGLIDEICVTTPCRP